MSREAYRWAWAQELPATAKLVLLALAEHADPQGVCWPGQSRLAGMCGLSVRHLRRVCRELADRGLLKIEHRAGCGSGRFTDSYRLVCGTEPAAQPDTATGWATGQMEQGNRTSAAGNRTSETGQPDTGVRQTVREKEEEAEEEPPPAFAGDQQSEIGGEPVRSQTDSRPSYGASGVVPDRERRQAAGPHAASRRKPGSGLTEAQQARFDRFWGAYPRKVAKGEARKAWRKLDPDDDLTEQICEAIETAKAAEQWRKDEGRFIPYPATWLRREGWEDRHEVEIPPLRQGERTSPAPRDFERQRMDRTATALQNLFGEEHGDEDLPGVDGLSGRGLRQGINRGETGRVLGPARESGR